MLWLRCAPLFVLLCVLLYPASAQPAPLRVGTTELPPFVIAGDDSLSGFSIDLWEAIALEAELAYEWQLAGDISELLAGVEQGELDLGIAGIPITRERAEQLDFSHPVFNAGLQILVPLQSELIPLNLFRAFLSPTLLQVLVLLTGIIVIAGHIVWLVERHSNPDFQQPYLRGVWEGIWWATVTVISVGYGDRTPRSLFGRLFAMLLMFIGVALVAHFTALITTNFTLNELRGEISTFNDLYGREVVTLRDSPAEEYLRSVNLRVVTVSDINEAYAMLESGEAEAIVYDIATLLYFAATEGRGRFQLIGAVFNREDYGIALPPESPYRKIINLALLELIESGTYQQIYDRWFG